ncbi:MAG: hypothetical protein ABFD13_03790 [Candidatus Cryosericum sp.]|nr:hypothetical protein [bacterium]
MTRSIEPAEPVTVEVALGLGTPQAMTVHWETGTLYARAGSEPQVAFQPSLEAWKRFWRAVDKADVWNWDCMDQADQPVVWRLALDSGAKRVTASGQSSATDEFKMFVRALKKLLPGISLPFST